MTKKRSAIVALLLLLPFGGQRPEPIVVRMVAAPAPAVELCVQDPGELPPALTPVDVPLADPEEDTGGPMVTLNVRGTLVIESVRDDGTPEPSPTLELINCPPSWQLEQGATSIWLMDPGTCAIMAWRADGMLGTPQPC